MNEVQEVVEAFDAAKRRGERCALATIVSVDGTTPTILRSSHKA